MHTSESGASSQSGDRNGHQAIASELVSLIEHVQTSMKLLEAAIASESASGDQEAAAGNVFILDDVMPRYVKANAALSACNAGLGVALHYLLDARAAGTDPPSSRPTAIRFA